MSFKLSQFNNVFKRHGEYFLWNTLSGAFLRIGDAGKMFVDSYDGSDMTGNDYFDVFRKNRAIVDSRFDELGQVLIEEKLAMLDPNPEMIQYTVAPGLSCNYNCVYCFEKHRNSFESMTEATLNDVCAFISKETLEDTNLKNLDIRWFGGEPLLYTDTIVKISRNLMSFCNTNGIRYSAGIITNGRFLDKATAKTLRECNVEYVQLAMDGTAEFYAKQKQTTTDDFYATVDNIVASSEILPITIRINVTDDFEEALRLTDYLLKEKLLDGKIKMNLAHVWDYDTKDIEGKRLSHTRYLEFEKYYFSLFSPNGPYLPTSLDYMIPVRHRASCMPICNRNFCIGPEGELYRCDHRFGRPEYVVGTVSDGRFYSSDERHFLSSVRPQKCNYCGVLPICMGGCICDEVAVSCDEHRDRLCDLRLRSIIEGRSLARNIQW